MKNQLITEILNQDDMKELIDIFNTKVRKREDNEED